jgi:cell division transport system permease protein
VSKTNKIGQFPNTVIVLSLSFALFIIGLCGLLSFQARHLSTSIKQNVFLSIYLDNNLDSVQINALKSKLSKASFAASTENGVQNILFTNKTEAAKDYVEATKEDFTEFLDENPLHDSFYLKVNEAYFSEAKLKEAKAKIEKYKGVFEVTYVENLADEINANFKKIFLLLSVFVILLLILVIVLVNNTIRLAVFSQRFLIRSMQLIGATDDFIQKPFMVNGAKQGLFSAGIAVVLLLLVKIGATNSLPELNQFNFIGEFLGLSVVLCVLGVLIGVVCTYSSIHKYLSLTLEQLYK